MMNSIEALNKLYMACDNDLLYKQSGIMFPTELTKIIQQDLDRLETFNYITIQNVELREENTKLKEAIKIIINKGVNKLILKNTKIFAEYNTIIKHLEYFDELTQKEYKLLKEVFKNE